MYSRSSGSGRRNYPSVILTLVVLSWSWSSFLIIPTEAFTADEVSDFLQQVGNFILTIQAKGYETEMEKVVGPLPFVKTVGPPSPGQKTKDFWYDNLRLAYHFNVYGSRFYDRGRVLMKWWNELVTRIRRYQINYKDFQDFVFECGFKKFKYDAVKATDPDGEEMKAYVSNCSSLEEYLHQDAQDNIELYLQKGVVYAYHLIASFIHVACYQGTNNYRFNGKIITSGKDGPKIGLFNRMNQEYLDLGNAIPDLLEKLRSHVRQLGPLSSTPYGQLITGEFNRIDAKLKAAPFDQLYVKDAAQRKLLYDQVHDWKFCANFSIDIGGNSHFVDEHKFAFDWELDMIDIYGMWDNRGPWKQLISGLDAVTPFEHELWKNESFVRLYDFGATPAVKKLVDEFYTKFMLVEELPEDPTDVRYKNFETWDGKWDWKITGTDPRNILHRIRLGTDLLDSVVEELKCYLNETYTRDKRDEMVKNYTQSVDWENAKLYNLISETYARPCVTANETDLVGSCTRENHEICLPMYYNTVFQDPLDNIKGGMSLMKPKWYYRKMSDGKCQGKRTYITHYKICQCGFRQDCGSDLKGNPDITCQFVENDLIRKQCRGSIAYPCRTHPFQKGKPHETCATGFCDLDENSCERWHWHIFE